VSGRRPGHPRAHGGKAVRLLCRSPTTTSFARDPGDHEKVRSTRTASFVTHAAGWFRPSFIGTLLRRPPQAARFGPTVTGCT
jgi:hypothetical protein